MKIDSHLSAVARRRKLEQSQRIRLPAIGAVPYDESEPVHCENSIGATTIPLGIAGPLRLAGRHAEGEYIVPLATTEGALVASVNRGCKAITLSGGAAVRSENAGVTRAPVFEVPTLDQAFTLRLWLQEHFLQLQQEAGETSSHIRLVRFDTKIIGRQVYVRLHFDTGEAMGMNMATIAAEKIVSLVEREGKAVCIALSGNYCTDKKPSFINFVSGRGREGWAEIEIPQDVLKTVLKTTAEKIFAVWLDKSVLGSVASGSMGNNAHFANIVAAFYAATGQDLAHTVEGSMGMTSMKILPRGSLYFGVYLPAIMLGIVGGGTKLKIKKEALSIMGVKSADALAEVLTGAVLAGELSLLASLAQGTLSTAHARLGR